MKQMNELALSAPDEEQASSIAKLIECLADIFIEAGPVVRRSEEQALQHRQERLQFEQRIEAASVHSQKQLEKLSRQVASLEQAVDTIARETVKSTEYGSRVNQRFEAFAFNLEQVRILMDTFVQKQQELVNDFIQRHVTDHLFKEFLNIQFALARYSSNPNGNLKADIQATAEAIESFLAESGLQIIDPSAGAPFQPREHLPVQVLPTSHAQVDGTIAETFTPGLSRSTRVIQQARVAVFKAEEVKAIHSQ